MIGGPAYIIRAAVALALAGALLCGASGASAATASATATGTLVSPLAVVKTDDLDFGGVIPSATAGTATINPSTDARTTSGGVAPAGGSPSAAHFTAAGRIGAIALISLPASITLIRSGGAETMTVTGISTAGGTLRLFPGAGTIDVAVGGTLNVAANQVGGTYAGTFTVNILYF
jgi:hypothetical protein